MARPPRVQIEGAVYAVTSEGGVAEPLFKDPQDHAAYLGLVTGYKKRYGFKLFAYCSLPRQVHLCLEPSGQATISVIMHDITAAYTRYYNKRYGRTGHLFQKRFTAVVVEKRHALLPLTAYVHTAPTRMGVVRDLREHPCSSYASYRMAPTSTSAGLMDAEIRDVVSLLASAYPGMDYASYVDQFSQGEAERMRLALQQRVVGSEEFVRMVKEKLSCAPPPVVPVMTRGRYAVQPRAMKRPWMALGLTVVVIGSLMASWRHDQRAGFLKQALLPLMRRQEGHAGPGARFALAVQTSTASDWEELEGTAWEIQLMPMYAADSTSPQRDHLTFHDGRIASQALAAQGVQATNYTLTVQPNGAVLWETIQTSQSGDVICWRGEREGQAMRGIVTRQTAGRAAENFTFVGAQRPMRSET